MTDAELERLLAGSSGAGREPAGGPELEPGARVEGTVVEVRGGEVLVEIDGKSHAIIEASEYADEDPPAVGDRVSGTFERDDPTRGLAVISVRGVRKDVTFEELRPGVIVEGIVDGTNRGGLSLNVRGIPAFLPVSQIERSRVEDLEPYVGKKLRCQVSSVLRETRSVVLSRRAVLEMEAEVERSRTFATLTEGQILRGTVVRIADFGAFVDLGGTDGLLPAAKIRARQKALGLTDPLHVGQQITVQIVKVDRERERVSLDFKEVEAESWSRLAQHYAVGDEVTGWVSSRTEEGLIVSIEEGITGLIPSGRILELEREPRPGAILKASVTAVEADRMILILKPSEGRGGRG